MAAALSLPGSGRESGLLQFSMLPNLNLSGQIICCLNFLFEGKLTILHQIFPFKLS